MTTGQVLTVIGLVGFGGLLQIAFDFFVESKKVKQTAKQTLKETRYKAIIILCYAF